MWILIVDDHEIVREGLKTILRDDPDFEVVAESGSAEGIVQLAQRTQPDVVLLDARLPGVSGVEACRQLVAADPDIAVLMVSSYSDDRLVEESPLIAAKVLNRLRSKEELASAEPSSPLSHTQLEILRLIAVGFSNREIAGRIHLSENTVKSHIQQIFRKLDVGNRVEAALRASKEGWL
jgi:DNA-binding NarL/FixJ family response regulator